MEDIKIAALVAVVVVLFFGFVAVRIFVEKGSEGPGSDSEAVFDSAKLSCVSEFGVSDPWGVDAP